MSSEAELKKLKVTELKDLLKAAELPVSGKKDELIARLLEHQQTPAADPTPPPAEAESVAVELPTEPSHVEEQQPAPEATAVRVRDEEEVLPEPEAKRVKVGEDVVMDELVQPAPVELSAPKFDSIAPPPPVVAEDKQPQAAQEPQQPVEEEEEPPVYEFEAEEEAGQPTDLYLDTVNRNVLDFDFERLCSVTLSHNNIYACLVDGKYFQGRGKSSPAYAHSIHEDKHVFINLTTQKVYVLPDGYEVNDPSLDDIKYLLYPTYTTELLSKIDNSVKPALDLHQQPYWPGFVGLNNIKANTYMTCVLHALVHVGPLRDYFILDPHANDPNATELVKRFGMLCRKVWNPRAFKGQVSPHELLQECSNLSQGRFKITAPGDPIEFLGWLLNALHRDLGGNKKPRSSIVYSAFQGEVRVDDQKVLTSGEYGGKPRFDLDRDISSTKSPFLFLAIDLPPPPVFQGVVEKDIIPQVPISTVLAKYDGSTTQEANGVIKRFKITRLPPFLILHMKRFTKNNFVEEKNPTIVNFPLRGVDLQDYVDAEQPLATYYDLLANVTHSSAAGTAREENEWKTHVHLRPPRDEKGRLREGLTEDDERWFEILDLHVEEINKGMVPLAETYIQVWERRLPGGREKHELKVEVPRKKEKGLPVGAK